MNGYQVVMTAENVGSRGHAGQRGPTSLDKIMSTRLVGPCVEARHGGNAQGRFTNEKPKQ